MKVREPIVSFFWVLEYLMVFFGESYASRVILKDTLIENNLKFTVTISIDNI